MYTYKTAFLFHIPEPSWEGFEQGLTDRFYLWGKDRCISKSAGCIVMPETDLQQIYKLFSFDWKEVKKNLHVFIHICDRAWEDKLFANLVNSRL